MSPFVLTTAAKDLRRRRADPVALVIWIGIPAILGVMLSLVIGGGGGGTPTAHVLVVDEDDSLVSGLLTAAATQGPLAELIELEAVDRQAGQERIGAGEATALLMIPEGFGQAVLEERPTALTLVTNPAQRILPAIVQELLEVLVEVVFYGQRLLGEPIRAVLAQVEGTTAPSDAEVAGISVLFNQALAGAGEMLFPPVLVLEMDGAAPAADEAAAADDEAAAADDPATADDEAAATDDPTAADEGAATAGEEAPAADDGAGAAADDGGSPSSFDIGRIFLPGLVFMSVLFIAQGMSDDLWQEKAQGTLRRAVAAPPGVGSFLAGKLLAGTVVIGAVALVALVVGVLLLGSTWPRLPLALGWCAFTGTSLFALFLALQLAASSQRGASLLSNVVLFPFLMIGGSFFPFETMPDWMAAVGRWTPNGLAVVQLREILFGQPAPLALLAAAAGICLPGVAAFLLAVRRLRGGFAAS